MSNRLRLIRKDLGLTQIEVAKYLGIDQVTISKYELSKRKFPIKLAIKMIEMCADRGVDISFDDIYVFEKLNVNPSGKM